MGRVSSRRRVVAVDLSTEREHVRRMDTLVVEEPLEIRVDGRQLAVTMRTPGADIDLVHGLLLAEGIIRRRSDVSVARYCAGAVTSGQTGLDENTYNVIDVTLSETATGSGATPVVARTFTTSSACGVCGAASIDSVLGEVQWPPSADDSRFPATWVAALTGTLEGLQPTFERTGGLHAAALVAPDGVVVAAREDIGRHNAVDKVVGHALRHDLLPLRGHALVVSSRASFELAQKAAMAGVPLLATVSAASSLAVDVAEQTGVTLVGFARGPRFTVYSHPERVTFSDTTIGKDA